MLCHPQIDYWDDECILYDLNSIQDELNFFTNSTSYRDYKNCLIFKRSILKTVPAAMFAAYKNIEYMGLSKCEITQIDENSFEYAQNLKRLHFKHNKISFLKNSTFNGADNLERLDLSFNQIENLPSELFSKLINLNDINLRHNKISFLDDRIFASLKNLSVLVLKHNKLRVISPNLFAQNLEISVLDFSQNQISEIEDSIKNLNKLFWLDLTANRLTKFSIKKNIKKLSVHNNQISTISVESDSELTDLFLDENKIWSIEDIENLKQFKPISKSFLKNNQFVMTLCLNTKLMPSCKNFILKNDQEITSMYLKCVEEFLKIIIYD